jgi:hypothetical protein
VSCRQGDYEGALHHRLHAATIKERSLGQNQAETVACLIECLRLTVRKNFLLANRHRREKEAQLEKEKEGMNRYALAHLVEKEIGMLPEDRKNFSLVGFQATEVSRRIDKLNQFDHEAALRLAGKCYQLVALTDLIVAGELDPTQSMCQSQSQSQPEMSLKSRQTKKKKGERSERSEKDISQNQNGNSRREVSVGSLRYLQSLAENGKKNIPTVSFNLLHHTLFGESSLLKRSEVPR